MKTDELLSLLSQDTVKITHVPSFRFAVFGGVLASILALFFSPMVSDFGIRPNYFSAISQGVVAFKQ